MNTTIQQKKKLKVKKIFFKQGTCSRAFFYLLNQEFGNSLEQEEKASDPFAGGILQQGYQCGLLWGATMAIGAESFRRNENLGISIGQTIRTTQLLLKSFVKQTNSIECEDITEIDFSKKLGLAKFFFTGKFLSCYTLADKCAPDAINSVKEGLSLDTSDINEETFSCASEVIKEMGGTEKEMAMVAGFAGGLGLSGSACGALSAAIWKTILELVKKDDWKASMSDTDSDRILKRFYEATDYKMECSEICGRSFKTFDEHTDFIRNGGCEKLINIMAEI